MRKKLFAIVMSMTMVASFMPSMAFAAHTHTPTLASPCDWDAVETLLNGKDAKYVDVVKQPTHEETGLVKITCKDDFCKEVTEVTVNKLQHEWVSKDLSLEEYAEMMLAYGKDSKFSNSYKAAAWVKANSAYCYMKDVQVCSCGAVKYLTGTTSKEEHRDAGTHKVCEDFTCAQCGKTVEATTTHDFVKIAGAKKVSDATCGQGAGYEGECSRCDAKGVAYEATTNGNAHNLGSAVDAADATTLKSNGMITLKKGYIAYKVAEAPVVGNGTTEYAADAFKDYKLYKLEVITAGTCEGTNDLGITCKTCGLYLKNDGGFDVAKQTLAETDVDHDYEETTVAATCDHGTIVKKVCKVCGDTPADTEDVSKKLNHSYKVTKTPATCGTQDTYTIECTTCESKCAAHKKTYTLAQLKATGTYDVVVDTTAKTETVYWDGYEHELKGNNKIAMTYSTAAVVNHKWGADALVKEATCTSNAVYGKKCTECGKYNVAGVYEKAGTKLAHNFVKNEVAATCGVAGYTYEQCSTCDGYKLGNTVSETLEEGCKTKIAPVVKTGTACTFDKWVVTKKPTVFEKGVEALVCSVCGADGHENEAIDKLSVAKASNTVKAGKKSFNVKSSAANATGYRVYYKKAGAKSWKSYTKKTASLSKTFSGLSKGKYYVKVKAYAKNYAGDGEVVWGAYSATKTVKVK